MRPFVIQGWGAASRSGNFHRTHHGRISIGQKGLSVNIRQGDKEGGRMLNLSSTEIAWTAAKISEKVMVG